MLFKDRIEFRFQTNEKSRF